MVFLDFISYHWIRIVCVTQEYQRFLPKAVSVFAGRRCMSVMLFDRTTNKLCLCLSATRRYFAARTKRVFYSLYIQGEMQMETIFILQNDAKYNDLYIVKLEWNVKFLQFNCYEWIVSRKWYYSFPKYLDTKATGNEKL